MTILKKPLAITMGDAAGIGPEIIAKAFVAKPNQLKGCFVVGDVATMQQAMTLVAHADVSAVVVPIHQPEQALAQPEHSVCVLQVGPSMEPVVAGRVSGIAGEFAARCIVWAANAALKGQVSAVVTAPIHKESLHAGGDRYARFPGHTELLQSVAADFAGVGVDKVPVRMMLVSPELRTVLVSIHCSLRQAIEAVSVDNVLESLEITQHYVGRLLGYSPKIAVAGLNPHAGEGALFGTEERDIIAPAIALAQQRGIYATGPWAPDTIFMRARKGQPEQFDVVLAMYHDQGLIPIKYLGTEHGVNVTLGLPFVRTSPDHGTAFDIAGTGRADPSSLLAAIEMAQQGSPL